MRITFVLPGGGGGGGARVIVRFADGLMQRGHQVRILYAWQHQDLREKLRDLYLGLRYGHRHDWLRTCATPVHPYTSLTADLAGHNDVLVAVGVTSVLAIAELPASCGIKVHNSHGTEPWIDEQMARAWALPMPRIVSASYLVEPMRRQGSTDSIFVVGNGVDTQEYYPAAPPDLRRGVGTIYHGGSPKDPRTLVATLKTIRQRHPDVPINVFGSFPRPADLPADATYVRLPDIETARQLYSRSLVWFCASRYEGFGLPLLEAMACGCAVVSTDCGGPSDIIESGTNGWLVPTGDASALADRVTQLLQDTPLRERFVAAGQAVLKRFTWPAMIDRYEAALREIVASGGSSSPDWARAPIQSTGVRNEFDRP